MKNTVKIILNKINSLIESPKFWNNKIEAEKKLKEKKNLDLLTNSYKESKKEEKDLYDIFLLAKEENNNQILSENRAKAVVSFLLKMGVSSDQLHAKGYGSQHPIAENSSETGRMQNRRTECRILP